MTQRFFDSFLSCLAPNHFRSGRGHALCCQVQAVARLGESCCFPGNLYRHRASCLWFSDCSESGQVLPFVLVPVLAALIVYMAIAVGFMQPSSQVRLCSEYTGYHFWLYGCLVMRAVIQIVILAMSAFVYFHL